MLLYRVEKNASCIFSVGVAPPHPGLGGLCPTGNRVNMGMSAVNSVSVGIICVKRGINVWSVP